MVLPTMSVTPFKARFVFDVAACMLGSSNARAAVAMYRSALATIKMYITYKGCVRLTIGDMREEKRRRLSNEVHLAEDFMRSKYPLQRALLVLACVLTCCH
jgi:hypothetical protein